MLNKTSPEPSADQSSAGQPSGSFDEARSFADAAQRGASVIRREATLEGSISGGAEILVDGVVKGDVHVKHVVVGPEGRVEGEIVADLVEVRGRVSGAITGKHVRLCSAASVQADITHEQLAIEAGATFEGRSLRLKRP
jgi:cytoskeletal protein CcmA (bactofilin family)